MATITILGAGMMGTALTWPLADRGHEVRLVGTHLDDEIIRELKAGRPHPKLKLDLPAGVRPLAVGELGEAANGADVIALGVSSAGVRWAGKQIAPLLSPGKPVLMISKGLEWDGERLSVLPDVLTTELHAAGKDGIAPVAVGGPCIAGELARRVDTCIVFTGRGATELAYLTDLARGPYYRVFPSTDVLGVETCAALKNAFAMGVGFAAGLHEKRGGQPGSIAMHNHEAATFAQSIVEMQHIVSIVGGDPRSAAWLPGAGDLTVTNNGGRTGRFGRWLGLGLSLDEAIAKMEGATLECLEILDVMRRAIAKWDERAAIAKTELPFLRHLCAVARGAQVDVPFEAFFSGFAQ
jgi:glycerol-3-phosphate dehydrogenase (NAD(P)+)